MSNFWRKKKIVITGANGFLGSHMCKTFAEKGADVLAIVSMTTQKNEIRKELLSPRIKILRANLLLIDDCYKITRDSDAVLNFAALDGGALFKQQHPVDIFETNTRITLNILNAAYKMQCKRFLVISSIEVYAKNQKKLLKEEDGFIGEVSEGYAWSKRFSEVAAKMYYNQYGLDIVIARLGNVYGPGDDINLSKGRVIPQFIYNSLMNKDITILGTGEQERTFLYVGDATRALLELLEHAHAGEVYNIASNQIISIKDLANKVITLIGSKNKVIYRENQEAKLVKRKISTKKAEKIINLKERYTLNKGLSQTINYMKELYK